MTLQYRIRSKYWDQVLRQRVYLCEHLVADAYNRWCLSADEFAIQSVVAGTLFLFSPRCEPFELSRYQVGEQLAVAVGTPEDEYRLTWPKRDEAQGRN